VNGYWDTKGIAIGYGLFARNAKREDGLFYQLLSDQTIVGFAINAMPQFEVVSELKEVIVG